MQKHLKVLRLSYLHNDSLFQTDKLTTNIKFSLDELSLIEVNWTNNENAMKFFKTQTNLKKVTLNLKKWYRNELDKKMWYDELLIHLFSNNVQLNTVDLSFFKTYGCNITDLNFLNGIVNPKVENLKLFFDSSPNGTELVTVCSKLFPNVKNFNYKVANDIDHSLNQIRNWKSLESLHCDVEDINQILENVNIGGNLTNFSIRCFNADRLKKPQMIEFLNRHQNIKHLSFVIGDETTISDEILALIANTLKSIKTLICKGTICSLSKYSK